MEPQLSRWEKMQLVLHLNKIDDPMARQAYIEHRRTNMCCLLVLFLASKVIHLIHLIFILTGDLAEYADGNSQMHTKYASKVTNANNKDAVADASHDELTSDCIVVIGQYVVVIAIIIAALLITRNTNYYIGLLAWIIALV